MTFFFITFVWLLPGSKATTINNKHYLMKLSKEYHCYSLVHQAYTGVIGHCPFVSFGLLRIDEG